jgi:PAS domain S-box-containing protein
MAESRTAVLRAPAEPPAPWEAALAAAGAAAVDTAGPRDSLAGALGAVECALADGGAPDAVQRVSRAHRADPTVQAVIVAAPADRARIDRAILFTPGLGEVWVVPPEEVGPRLALRAADVTRDRRRYQRTRTRVAHDLAVLEPQRAQRAVVSDAYLAALLDAAPDPILSIDEAGRVLSWNPAAERVLGHSRDDAAGRPLAELLTPAPSEAPLHLETLPDAALRRDLRFLRAGGEPGAGELIVVPVEVAGHRIGAVILHDRTEERRARDELEEQAVELEHQLDNARTLNAELEESQHEARLANAALHASEARFRLLFERNPLPMWVYDVRTLRFLEVNRAAVERYGYGRGEFLAMTLRDIRPPEELAALDRALAASRDGVARWSMRHRWKDGTVRLVEITTADTVYQDHEARVAVVLDLTERMEAEAALRESEAQFRTLAESIPQLGWMAHADGHIFWYNRRWYDYTGTTPEEMEGWGWRKMHDPEVLPRVVERWTASIRDGEPFEMEFPLRRHDGRFRAFLTRVVPVRDGDGRVFRWIGTNTDVEELRSAERELAAARAVAEARADDAERAGARLAVLAQAGIALAASLDTRQTLDSLCRLIVPRLAEWCGVYLAAPDGTLERHQFAGYAPAAEDAYRELLERYPPSLRDLEGTFGHVMRTGGTVVAPPFTDEVLAAIARDGEHLRLLKALHLRHVVFVPLRVGERTLGALSLGRTRDEQPFGPGDVELAEELARRAGSAVERARLYEEALSASRAKTEFLATMSHELRTPLNAMIGYSDLLLAGIPEPLQPASHRQVERIRSASRHLLSIIEEILTFSRIEAGRETVRREAVDLAELVREVSAIVEPLAGERRLRFLSPEAEAGVTLETDPRKLRQILINLLGNAVKFTEAGEIAFEIERGENAVAFRVRDTGIGIRPEHLGKVFEPFWQVNATATRDAEGTGLGLSVSRELARLLGGDLTVESEPDVGSTFTLTLPLRPAESAIHSDRDRGSGSGSGPESDDTDPTNP